MSREDALGANGTSPSIFWRNKAFLSKLKPCEYKTPNNSKFFLLSVAGEQVWPLPLLAIRPT